MQLVEQTQRLVRVRDRHGGVPGVGEDRRHDFAQVLLIVENEDSNAHMRAYHSGCKFLPIADAPISRGVATRAQRPLGHFGAGPVTLVTVKMAAAASVRSGDRDEKGVAPWITRGNSRRLGS